MDEPVERVWEHMKKAATEWCAAGRPSPLDGDAHAVVRHILSAEGVAIPVSTLHFYAAEFTEMVRLRSK